MPCCRLPIQGVCKRTGASRVFGRRGVAPSVLAARGKRIFEGAAVTRATGARLPAGARALRDSQEAPSQQQSRTPLHKVLRVPPEESQVHHGPSHRSYVIIPSQLAIARRWNGRNDSQVTFPYESDQISRHTFLSLNSRTVALL